MPPRKITPPHNCPLDDCSPDNCLPWAIALEENWLPRTIAPEDNCPPREVDPGKLPPYHRKSSENNLPHLSKFPLKSTRSELRKTMHCLPVQKLFLRLQLRNKKWFTSVYFLQIFIKPCRTPLKSEHLWLNASWFPYDRTQTKYNFWKNWFEKKFK